MNITMTRPDLYSSGRPCFVTENGAYPGIVGYGDSESESRASYEAARAAYLALTAPSDATREDSSATSVSWTFANPVTAPGSFAAA